MLLAVFGLGAASPAQQLLADDFASGGINAYTWFVTTQGIPQGPSVAFVQNQACVLQNRAHLVSTQNFDAARLGGYRVRCRWTWTDAYDRFQLLIRSDGVPGGNYGETQNGIELAAGMETTSNAHLWMRGNHIQLGTVVTTGPGITFAVGIIYTAELWDTGTHVGARIEGAAGQWWEFRAPVLQDTGGFRRVVFHNRENTMGSHQCVLDDVTVERVAPWRSTTVTSGPSARLLPALALEPQSPRVMLFGGVDGTGTYLADTWQWDGSAWQALPLATAPSPRATRVVADTVRQRLVLFGGETTNLAKLGDTWEFDGTAWTAVAPANAPSARAHHGMCFDSSRQRVVLFGGYSVSGEVDDTWEWDGGTWTQVAIPGPSSRHGTAMAYDAARQRTVLFGGGANGGVLGDTWEFDGTTWQQCTTPVAPPARSQHTLVAAPWLGGVVLVGGWSGSNAYDDHWLWNGASWRRLPGDLPSPRRVHAVAVGPRVENLVLFGGTDCSTCAATADLFEQRAVDACYAAFGAGCPGPTAQVPTLAAQSGLPPTLGTTTTLRLDNLPASGIFVPLLGLGFSNTVANGSFGFYSLPFDLSPLGWTGCQQWVSIVDLAVMATVFGPGYGYATLSIPLPNLPFLAGREFFAQALVLHAPTGASMSNGLHGIAGY
ncbi:MAG: kelch repeat-containing protein [Planctomycetota bacterium]